MDRQRNKDNSNFFSRIKNIDVLRSPYPRHLLQGGRTTGAATGTRVVPTSVTPHHSTARPAPVHPAPLWQTPVSRHSDLAISPPQMASHIGGAGQVGAPHISPYHPPPAEYPNSVQPLRSRPRSFPDQRFIMPGSTLPTHIRTGNSLRGLSSNTQVCVLHRWFASIDVDKRIITVSGSFTKTNGKTVLRHSTPIEQVHDSRILIASTGTVYQLASAADLELMRASGFPETLTPHFVDGFPRDWKQLVERYIGGIVGIGHRVGSFSRRIDGGLQAGLPKSQRRESYDGAQRRLSSDRVNTITESDEDLFEPRLAISPSNLNNRSSVGVYEPRGNDPNTSPGFRGSVYRTGADIFAQTRFAQPNSRQSSDTLDIASSSTVGGPAYFEPNESVDDTFNVLDKYESEEDTDKDNVSEDDDTALHKSPEEKGKGGQDSDEQEDDLSTQGTDGSTVHKLGGALDDMRVERESTAPRHLSLNHNDVSTARFASPSAKKQQQQVEESSDVDEKENEASTEQHSSATRGAGKDPLKRKSQGSKNQQRSLPGKGIAHRVVETSDEGVSDDDSDNESLTAKRAISAAYRTPFNSRRISGQKAATVSRATRRTSLLEAPTKPALMPVAPSSAPSDRVRANKGERSGKKPIAKPGDEDGDSSSLVSEKHSKLASENWYIDAESSKQGDKDSSAAGTSNDTTAGPGESKGDDPVGLEKTPSDASMTTPKRKKGRNYFRYTELPGPSISVTRSGRKVRRPNDWWANAQEHLSTGHKESDIKYKWGTGDPVLVKGGKRVKLSDYYMQSGGADPCTDEQISRSADEGSNDLATTPVKASDGSG